jgi:hypothetical protein
MAGCAAAPSVQPVEEGTVRATRMASSLVTDGNGGKLINEGGASLINEGGAVFGKPTTNGGSLINEGGAVFGKPTTNGGSLINEGGAVFAKPGQILMPNYFKGEITGLAVDAERLDGGSFPDVTSTAVAGDGSFTLNGPDTGKFFFASASFVHEDTTHRVRALAKADSSSNKLLIDTASTLLAAKVALAEQKRHLFTIDYQETQDLSNLVRTRLGDRLGSVQLDAANAELSSALDVLARSNEDLNNRIVRWEYTLDPTLARTPERLQPETGGNQPPPAPPNSPAPAAVPDGNASGSGK